MSDLQTNSPSDDNGPDTLVPGIKPSDKYWRTYTSIPQPGLNNRSGTLHTGQVVGGGTVVNAMFFNRGSKEDYDSWEELGNLEWGWKDLLPYFKKSESFTPATPEIAARYQRFSDDVSAHGVDGPVGTSYPPYSFAIIDYFYRAWESIGVRRNPQPDDGLAVGVFHSSLAVRQPSMTRSSASAAYYRPIADHRPNLHLLTGQRVSKVIFDGKRASGVEYFARGGERTIRHVRASREVLVAAGAQRTSQLALLSGIGSKKLLSELGIPVVEDLPGVGYNFQDQPSYIMQLNFTGWSGPTPDWLFWANASHPDFVQEQWKLYTEAKQGAYTLPATGGCDVAFLPPQNVTQQHEAIIDAAKKVDLAQCMPRGASDSVLRGYQAQQDILLKYYGSPRTAVQESAHNGGSGLAFVHLKPLSRGSMLINSTDPEDDPVIDFGTFMHPSDLDIMVAIYRKNMEFIRSGPMQELGTTMPDAEANAESDEEIIELLRNTTQSSWQHPVGTMAMMPRELGGVVDPELSV
ncbi:hypothetical protein CBER1_10358 [Cercospora berteroae]|uniref:Glucose-methanol-choline oxidoreductase N-terminal domain-containing protein n=1 Tax=Cercospora berteroae TaxID=357750 RepID=A0A2S6BXM5_9PEZI|nr:hypothetical protein CBER1_10358 [Cercospora berteroae]